MSEAFDKRLQELLSDNVRGSRAIAAGIADLLKDLLHDSSKTPSHLREILSDICFRLSSAHPSLVAVQKLCESVESALSGENQGIKDRVSDILKHWQSDRFVHAVEAMAGHLLPFLKPGCCILSHSYSSTVAGVLKYANNKLGNLRIVQTISYPMKEGVCMAEELADAEIDVHLVADAGAAIEVEKCDIVLLGADSIHENGVVNKLGSFGIAMAAQHFGVPVYVIADTSKIISNDREPDIEEHDPSELTGIQRPHIAVKNVYFDITPLELISGIVTEEGISTHESLPELF